MFRLSSSILRLAAGCASSAVAPWAFGAVALWAPAAFGHGGFFPGGMPAPTPPSPAGPGVGTPGPPGVPITPTMPTPSSPAMPGGGIGTGSGGGRDLESWRYWWMFNKDPYLQLREHVAQAQAPITPSAPEVANGAAPSMRPTRDQLKREVYPALKQVLEKETQQNLVMAALIAIAEIGVEPEESEKLIEHALASGNQSVSETAAFACGILGTDSSLATLRALYEDREEGRKLCGDKKEVHWHTRSTAAYGMGLMGGRKRTPQYAELIRTYLLGFLCTEGAKRSPQKDLRVATILALGMIPDPSRKTVAILERYFVENREKEETVCAHVPPAIARLLKDSTAAERERYAREAVATLEAPHRRAERLLRPGLPIAIGLLTRADETHAQVCVEALKKAVERDLSTNPECSYMALIALGQIAGSGPAGSDAEKALLSRLDGKAGRVTSRAWAALALGIEGFAQAERRALPANDPVGAVLLDMMRELRDPEQVSALALALGLRRHAPAQTELLRQLGAVKDDRFRGFFATSLALLNANDAVPPLREIVGNSTRRPTLLNQAAIALGILGDKTVVMTLTAILVDVGATSSAVQASVSDALGWVGDYRAVTPLVKMLADEKTARVTSARTYAAVALGLMGDKDKDTWMYSLSQSFNYFASVETLLDLVWDG